MASGVTTKCAKDAPRRNINGDAIMKGRERVLFLTGTDPEPRSATTGTLITGNASAKPNTIEIRNNVNRYSCRRGVLQRRRRIPHARRSAFHDRFVIMKFKHVHTR